MNDELRKHVLGIKTSNNELNEKLKSYFASDLTEKLNIFSALSQYLVVVEHKSKEDFKKVIGPILEDIKKMSEQEIHIRKLYSNYDTFMYTIHNLKYGYVVYDGIEYNADETNDRNKLLEIFLKKGLIELDDRKSTNQYKFIDKDLIVELKKQFLKVDESNCYLNIRAIILNLMDIDFF